MVQKTPVTVKTPYLPKYEGYQQNLKKKVEKKEMQMRKSSQTNLMETVNQIDDNRRSLSSLAMEEETKKANRKVSLGSLSIMDMTSQTNFFTNCYSVHILYTSFQRKLKY